MDLEKEVRQFYRDKLGGKELSKLNLKEMSDDELEELYEWAEWNGKVLIVSHVLKEADRRSKL